jgi:hypothetical protein
MIVRITAIKPNALAPTIIPITFRDIWDEEVGEAEAEAEEVADVELEAV